LRKALVTGVRITLCSVLAVCVSCGSSWGRFDFESETYDIGQDFVLLRGCRLDGAEKDDLALFHFYNPVRAEWLTHFPASLPGTGPSFEIEGSGQDILAADLDGDGLDDLGLLPDLPFYAPEHYGIYVLINSGNGQLELESFLPILTLSHIGRKLGSADIDGDGATELMLFNTQHEYVDPVMGPPPWGSVVFFDRADETGFSYSGYVGTCGWGFDFAVMNFNDDQYADVVTLSDWMTERIEVFVGGPGPSLTGPAAEVTIPELFVHSLAAVPVDDEDVLVAVAPSRDAAGHDQTGGLRFYVPSDGTLELVHTIDADGLSRLPLVEDLDLDGRPEIICRSWSGDTKAIVIFGNTENVTHWTRDTISLDDGPMGFTTGDFSGDGYPDILVISGGWRLTLLTQVPGGAGVPVCTVLLAVFGIAAICLVPLHFVRKKALSA